MVVAEALSFGLPVICLDNDGPGKLINDSSGYAVPQSNYEDTVQNLAHGLIQLFHNKNKRIAMNQAARQRFLDIFHWDRRGEQLKELYATL